MEEDKDISKISPNLSGIKKQNAYSIPEGYFDSLELRLSAIASPGKVVPIYRKIYFKYAVAACLAFAIAGSWFVFTSDTNSEIQHLSAQTIDVAELDEEMLIELVSVSTDTISTQQDIISAVDEEELIEYM